MLKSTQHQQHSNIKKKLRSKIPLRKPRSHFTPVLFNKAPFPEDAVSCLIEEASSGSSRVSVIKLPNISVSESSSCCIESFVSKKQNFNSTKQYFVVDYDEVSAVSAKEIVSDENDVVSAVSKRKLTDAEFVKENEQSDEVSFSSVANRRFNSSRKKKRSVIEVDVGAGISFSSAVDNFSEFVTVKSGEKCVSKSSVFSKSYCDESLKFESDLACTENLFNGVSASVQSSSQETLFTELSNEFLFSSHDYFSDYTDSLHSDSGSEFSQGDVDDSAPSLTFSLVIKFREQFMRSSCPSSIQFNTIVEDDYTSVRFEDEETEESYQLLRKRERRQLFLRDYTAEYGDLVFKQRSDMVSWIVEQSTAREYHKETVFLGVNLLARFLSKGSFSIEKNFQIVGIACLALATRIEENQPYNSVRQTNFHIASNVYSRSEVVAMEWLVMEVLEFKCFLPTIHNFLWFYLRAAKADAETEKRAKYLAVLVLLNPAQLCYWPSTVAAGLVILASLEGYQGASYHRVIEAHVRTKNDDLPECIKSMEWLSQYL